MYRYHGSKDFFDETLTTLKDNGYKVKDITEELHQHDNEANLNNGSFIWKRKLRHYGLKVTTKPKELFAFRHTSSDTLVGTEGMYEAVTDSGGKVNPNILTPLQGGTRSGSAMWTFALFTQRDIYFVTDHLETELLLGMVMPIPVGGDVPLIEEIEQNEENEIQG